VLALLGLHLGAIFVIASGTRRWGRWALAAACAPPLGGFALLATSRRAAHGDAPWTVSANWVERLDLGVSFELHGLAWLLTGLISIVGLAVFAYTAAYARPDSDGARLCVLLVGFSASMLGLVWAGDVWTLFVFWEATTICSFLLVGGSGDRADAVRAARHALVITGAGGLVLLGGLVVLALEAGSSDLAAVTRLDVTTAAPVSAAAIAVLVAAATKSALVPFSGWLPGAMAAPTPVSAFLHSATMVKAGVFVLVLFGPGFSELAAWRPLLLAMGGATMLWGGYRALLEDDLKVLLAHSTVSQLGLIAVLAGIGIPEATFAAVAVLVAHGVFKAALFLVVGASEAAAGTRDRHALVGIGRRHPLLGATAAVAGASMAGLPPTAGFVAKEAGIEALTGTGAAGTVALGLVAAGSILTVAYTVRLVTPFLARGDGGLELHRVPAAMRWAPAGLASVSLVGGLTAAGWTQWVAQAAGVADPAASAKELKLIPGWTTALAISAAVVAIGAVLGCRWQTPKGPPRLPRYADVVDRMVDSLIGGARSLTGRVQHGSLPGYVVVVLGVAVLPAGVVLASGLALPTGWRLSSSGFELAAAVAVVAAVALAARSRTRLGAVLAVGAVGYAVAGLFVTAGAPDLALTQVLVETLMLIGFVLVLRRLGPRIADVEDRSLRLVRPVLALGVGATVFVIGAAGLAARTASPPADALVQAAPEGGGDNVVNIILVNIRALDTLGEITVVLAAAAGVSALVRPGLPRPPVDRGHDDVRSLR